jgi:hypothetical protein
MQESSLLSLEGLEFSFFANHHEEFKTRIDEHCERQRSFLGLFVDKVVKEHFRVW